MHTTGHPLGLEKALVYTVHTAKARQGEAPPLVGTGTNTPAKHSMRAALITLTYAQPSAKDGVGMAPRMPPILSTARSTLLPCTTAHMHMRESGDIDSSKCWDREM